MSKYITYNQNTKEYNDMINSFLDKFIKTFPNYQKKEELKTILMKNLKKIKKLKKGMSIKMPILGYVNGLYHRWFKTMIYTENEEETIEHELFHALSSKATSKRISLSKIIAIIYLGQKQLDERNFEEGMTEYLTGCITSKEYQNASLNLEVEKNLVNKLAKIYGDELILDYYLGYNKKLIELINRDNPNNFKMINMILNNIEDTVFDEFSGIKYQDKKGTEQESSLIYELFSKEKLIPIQTIDDFKHNLHELFNFYEVDLYRLCYNINDLENRIENNKDQNMQGFLQNELNCHLEKFKKFNSIIRKEWNKLAINNETKYNELLLLEIENFNKFATPIIIDYLEDINDDIKDIYQNRNNNQFHKQYVKEELTKLRDAITDTTILEENYYQEDNKHKR